MDVNLLNRFLKAQEKDYEIALDELTKGRKVSHWMWYIFPQIRGLGHSDMSNYYSLEGIEEATAYLSDPVLGKRLIHLCEVLLNERHTDASAIFGYPDDLKLRSSMTLFAAVPNANLVFEEVINKFFGGEKDAASLAILDSGPHSNSQCGS